jgi:uridine phosphorylase
LPGDPGRVPLLAQRLEGARQVAANREFVSWSGELEGAQVTVTSTGIGCPSAAIAVEELHACGTDTFIRVGTAGGMQQDVFVGDLVVAEAAVRDEGTSPQYVPLGFPAVADPDVTLALREGARALDLRHHVGVVHSKDSFYGQREPERMPVADELAARWRAWIRAGVLCSEMEAAAIYVVARSLRARAGGLMLIAGNQELKGARRDAARLEPLLDGAIEGLRRLIRADG